MKRKPELGKYLLWNWFARHPAIRRYLPPTARYSAATFKSFLHKYGTVFVKPSGGSMGRGIIKVWRDGPSVRLKHTTRRAEVYSTEQAALHRIDTLREGKAYVVQKGIALARVNGKPMDIRVMMQREIPGGPWKYSGMVAKIAGSSSVVTNVALSRGSVMTVDEALRRALGCTPGEVRRLKQEMRRLGSVAARHFDSYQLYRELGFDVAVDTSRRVWLIEENTAPSHRLFQHLRTDPELYRTIQWRWGRYQRVLRTRRR